MDYPWLALFVTASAAIAIHLILRRGRKSLPGKLPPGSLGVPLIGQTLGVLRALHSNSIHGWIRDRIQRYGPVSKFSLFGMPMVLVTGPAGNKFMHVSSSMRLAMPGSYQRLFGKSTLIDLHGDEHRRIRGALMEFLRPDVLKQTIRKVDAEVRQHLQHKWYGRSTVTVQPLMQRLTFDLITSLLFGLEEGETRDGLADAFDCVMEGMFGIPVELSFTALGRGLKASERARRLLEGITRDNKAKLGSQSHVNNDNNNNNNNLIRCLLSQTDEHGQRLVSDEQIVDNCMLALLAGRDTTSILVTFMLRHLANDPVTLAAMAQEHQDVAKNKADGDALTWEDLSKMKFTWRVAQETLRIVPPSLGPTRRTTQDLEFGGYCIPKGWKVFISSNMIHMDPSIFPEPAKFDPSRFEKPTPPFSFLPFGGGPRTCPGMDLAKIETLVIMHYLVRNFRWSLCCKENTFTWFPLPSTLRGLPIMLEPNTSL